MKLKSKYFFCVICITTLLSICIIYMNIIFFDIEHNHFINWWIALFNFTISMYLLNKKRCTTN